MILEQDLIGNLTDCWVFGYGSILWNPGFSYESRHTGYVEGYARRFWQGSTTHRGTTQSPGRVATLVEQKGERVWGDAFHLVGTSMIEACLRHLGIRECHLGGYDVLPVTVVAADTESSLSESRPASVTGTHQAWAFVASPNNRYYLGPAPVEDLATQVVNTSGSSGPNADYVTRLAEYVRAHIPQDTDEHLFKLDAKIRQLQTSVSLHHHEHVKKTVQPMTNIEERQVEISSRKELLLNYGGQGREASVSATIGRIGIGAGVVSVRAC